MCYKGMAYRGYLLPPVDFLSGVQTRSKFYQHFTSAFFTRKCFAQLFSNYSLALWLFGKRISVKKLLVTCWWNWLQVSIPSTFYEKLFYTKVLSLAFLFCFYFIGKRKTGKKAACKMLVKLTDIACQVFSEKIMFRNCKTSETIERSFEGWKKFQNKLTRLLICSILESRYQFHQRTLMKLTTGGNHLFKRVNVSDKGKRFKGLNTGTSCMANGNIVKERKWGTNK